MKGKSQRLDTGNHRARKLRAESQEQALDGCAMLITGFGRTRDGWRGLSWSCFKDGNLVVAAECAIAKLHGPTRIT